MRKLSPRESKLVAIGLLVLAIALVFLIVVNPILGGFADRKDRREQLVQTFHMNERRIAALPLLQHEAEAEVEQMHALFMVAPDADQAGEALRERVEAATESGGGQIKSSESAPGDNGWTRAVVEARLSHAQLAALLVHLNELKPSLAVDGVTVIAEDALNNFKSDQLDVRIETSAPFILAR